MRIISEMRAERLERGDKKKPTYSDAIKLLLDHYERARAKK